MEKIIQTFAALGWAIAPPSLARSMGSAVIALASFDVPAATWRIRIGKRVVNLERRAHGTPTGRASCGHWQAAGTVDTPRTLAGWRTLADALTGEALAFESDPLASFLGNPNRHSYATLGDGSAQAGRGSCRPSNPSRLESFGFSPASGRRILPDYAAKHIDASGSLKAHNDRRGFGTPDAKVIAARKARRCARRLAMRLAKAARN